jgi:hypothetical protein
MTKMGNSYTNRNSTVLVAPTARTQPVEIMHDRTGAKTLLLLDQAVVTGLLTRFAFLRAWHSCADRQRGSGVPQCGDTRFRRHLRLILSGITYDYAVGLAVVMILVEVIHISPAFAPLGATAVMTPINFIGSSFVLGR